MNRDIAIRSDLLPSAMIVLAGTLWGLLWLPLRAFADLGVDGAWPGAMIYGMASVVLLPLALWHWRGFRTHWRPLLISGLFTGTAFATYATSLLLTDVVRTILLFYLTPVWSTLMGIALLGERLTLPRAASLLLGIVGMLVVLGLGTEFPWPRNLGDWMALFSGVVWAYGSLKLYQMGPVATIEQILSFLFSALIVTLIALSVDGDLLGVTPSHEVAMQAVPLALLSVVYIVPMLFLTVWPASQLSPGRIGILLMSEVVVGVTSAALFAGEVFGLREFLGSILIILAGLVEVLGRQQKA